MASMFFPSISFCIWSCGVGKTVVEEGEGDVVHDQRLHSK